MEMGNVTIMSIQITRGLCSRGLSPRAFLLNTCSEAGTVPAHAGINLVLPAFQKEESRVVPLGNAGTIVQEITSLKHDSSVHPNI